MKRLRLHRVVCVWAGHPDYERVIGPLRRRRRLLARMWRDAESRLDEEPGKRWWVAVPRWRWLPPVAMAWCAAVLEQRRWRCVNSYDRPGFRWLRLYPAVYRVRHEHIRYLPAVTYVYAQPLPLHLADGWQIVEQGDSSEIDAPSHHWYGLIRGPDQQQED